MDISEQLRAIGGFFDEAAQQQLSCRAVADEIDRLRNIEEAAKQIRADYQANRFLPEHMMDLIDALKMPNRLN